MHAYIHTYIHAYIHTHTHTHTHICMRRLQYLLITVTIRNVGDITSFADNYHADQLKNACLQFICLNLAPLLEGRYLHTFTYFVYCVYKAHVQYIP